MPFTVPKDDMEALSILAGIDGEGVRVAALDTGVGTGHPALRGRLDPGAGRNRPGGDPPDVTDRQGHGSHGVGISATEDVGAIMSGTTPGVTLTPLKVPQDHLVPTQPEPEREGAPHSKFGPPLPPSGKGGVGGRPAISAFFCPHQI